MGLRKPCSKVSLGLRIDGLEAKNKPCYHKNPWYSGIPKDLFGLCGGGVDVGELDLCLLKGC